MHIGYMPIYSIILYTDTDTEIRNSFCSINIRLQSLFNLILIKAENHPIWEVVFLN